MNKIRPEHIQGIIMNPFYVITVAPKLVEEHSPSISDEEWVQANASLIQKMGAEKWLTQLLDVLEGNSITAAESLNPFNAINIDPMFAAEHPPLLSREDWVQANVMLIPQLGTEKWLTQLLDVLEGDIVTAEDLGLAPSPTAGQTCLSIGKQKRKKQKKHKR